MLFAVVLLLLGVSSAQRPSNATICDYYAITNYGSNTTATQLKLMSSILALAFGGAGSLPNVNSSITGIFNTGTYQGVTVDLQPWFNGTKQSTNLNNQPVGIDWLDGGGTAPIYNFLSGSTPNLTFTNGSNEARLFSHWESAFQHIYGCTLVAPQPASGGAPLDLAYVHKFMDLDHNDIGHFIDQLTLASVHFGFSENDALSLSDSMNAKFNVRCSPPDATGHLYSLCQDSTCPLAFPSPDCAPYVDLGPSGVPVSSASGPSSTSPPQSTSSQAPPASSSPAQSSAASSGGGSGISGGGIAGAAIGGTALLFIFIGALIFLLRRRRPREEDPSPYVPNPSNASYQAPSYTEPHTSYMSHPTDGHPEGYWHSAAAQGGVGGGEIGGQMIAEMESPKSPDMISQAHLSALSGRTVSPGPGSTPGGGSPGPTYLTPGQMSPGGMSRKPVGG
ncbi:hypothetical protein N431DRAFT_446630 [Stipitochalara longipes BDJ]|nr:hypothetical protein N431DRAFT_446630 [Stipitochalara longipes BDJ]